MAGNFIDDQGVQRIPEKKTEGQSGAHQLGLGMLPPLENSRTFPPEKGPFSWICLATMSGKSSKHLFPNGGANGDLPW